MGSDAHTEPASDEQDTGPATLPPEPAERWITPAPEDFQSAPPALSFAWPIVWCAIAFFCWRTLACGGWHAH